MSPLKPYKFDAFISYSSLDRPWAKQLAEDLKAQNLEIFYDRTNLDVGIPWERQLDDSLDVAQHLIVLWTNNAEASKYVDYERTYFHVKARGSNSDAKQQPRREIIIQLQDPPPVVRGSLQMIQTLREKGAYDKEVGSPDIKNAWSSVVAQVEKSIRDKTNALHVLVAVLATTRDFLSKLDFDFEFRFGTMNSVITRMGFKSKEDLLRYYGETADEWCPFGDDKANIWTVLNKLTDKVAEATGGMVQIDWVPIGSDLWSPHGIEAAKREAARLVKELSLVVIDPISLVDDYVRDALDLIQGSFSNTQSAVMVLTPFRMLEPSASLRSLLQSRAISFSSLFYQPPVPPLSPFANFGVNIGDEVDMNRLVLVTLGQHFGMQKPSNPYTPNL